MRQLRLGLVWITLSALAVPSWAAGDELAARARGHRAPPIKTSPTAMRQAASGQGGGAMRNQFNSRMSRARFQLETLRTLSQTIQPGREIRDDLLFHSMHSGVRREAERATRRVVKDYLLEVTGLELTVQNLRDRHRRSRAARSLEGAEPGPTSPRKRFRFDLGVSHWQPEAEIRYDLERGSLKLSLNSRGEARLDYLRSTRTRTAVSVGFDAGDLFTLGVSHQF